MLRKIPVGVFAVGFALVTEALFWWGYDTSPKRHGGIPESWVGMPFYISFAPFYIMLWRTGATGVLAFVGGLIGVATIYSLLWLALLISWRRHRGDLSHSQEGRRIPLVVMAIGFGLLTEAAFSWAYEVSPKRPEGLPVSVVGMPHYVSIAPIYYGMLDCGFGTRVQWPPAW